MISNLYINRLSVRDYWHVWQFTIPYSFRINQTNPLSYKMWSNVIQWLSSPIHIFKTWTQIFSTHNRCILLCKLQEIFNPLLILITYAWCFHPTLIHVSCSVILAKLSHMHENLTFFIKQVWPYPIQEDIFNTWFIHTSYVRYIKFDEILTTFHIGLQVHKLKWWDLLITIKYAPREQSNMH